MSLFPRTIFGNESSFTPLFRLLDEFDAYTRSNAALDESGRRSRGHLPDFQPSFDVREVADAYELHGELPGLNKENLTVEFTGPQTLHVSGHIERSYSSGTPPARFLENTKTSGAVTESGETGRDEHAPTDAAKTTKEPKQDQKPNDGVKYWVAERSIGQFSRVFNFPRPVQRDGVTASLKDGILSLRIPKATKPESRRIEIN